MFNAQAIIIIQTVHTTNNNSNTNKEITIIQAIIVQAILTTLANPKCNPNILPDHRFNTLASTKASILANIKASILVNSTQAIATTQLYHSLVCNDQ